MILPNIFSFLSDEAKEALKGGRMVKFFRLGEVPQNTREPYSIWQQVGGVPYNSLSCSPVAEHLTIQIDCYASSAEKSRNICHLIEKSLELKGVVTSYRSFYETETKLFRSGFDIDFIENRS